MARQVVSQLPPLSEPVLDKAGNMTIAWRRFFESQWLRSGGFEDLIYAGLLASGYGDATIADVAQRIEEAEERAQAIGASIEAYVADQTQRLDLLEAEIRRLAIDQTEGALSEAMARIEVMQADIQRALNGNEDLASASDVETAMTTRIEQLRAFVQAAVSEDIEQSISDMRRDITNLSAQISQIRGEDNEAAILGLGNASVANTGTSGHVLPYLDTANTWSAAQTFSAGAAMGDTNLSGLNGISFHAWDIVTSLTAGAVAANSSCVAFNLGAPDTLTDITSTIPNLPRIVFRNFSANAVLFTHNTTKLRLNAGANFSLGMHQTIEFEYVSGTVWQEVGSHPTKWDTARTLSFTGDATGSGSVDGSANVATALTLATVNGSPGASGSSTAIPTVTVNGKGLVTSVTTNAVVAPAGTLTGATLAAGVTASSLTSVGTLTGLTMGGDINANSSNVKNMAGLSFDGWTTVSALTAGSVAANTTLIAFGLSSPDNLTDITSTIAGTPRITFRNFSSNAVTFIYNSSKLRLNSGADVVLGQHQSIEFVFVGGTAWQEV